MKKYPPTAKELRDWMDQKGLSNKDVAKALRLSDGRVVRFWTTKKDARPIPYPSWYTLRHKFRKRPDKPKKHDAEAEAPAAGSDTDGKRQDAHG